MNMKTKLLICLAALLGIAALEKAQETVMPRTRFTVKVLSEDNKPMPGATVTVYFTDPVTRQDRPEQGTTNDQGLYLAEGYFAGGPLGGSVTQKGFYEAGWSGPKINGLENERWQPWDETYTTHLRPVLNPVPFYARSSWIELPIIDQPCGYDLQIADWVKPYGKGQASDLVFTVTRRYESRNDFEVRATVTFTNKLDGIQEADMPECGLHSEFRWSRAAPESGYEPKIETWFKNSRATSYTQNATDQQMYFFRVRTVEKDGRIMSAHYGKIAGGFRLAPSNSATCKIQLTYYLNPTPLDRNMESDPKRNLLPGLDRMETPQFP